MNPNIQDVAKAAGVSPTTVSRVLNNRGYISEQTREKVYKAMKEIQYIPNDLARSLFHKRTYIIGLIVPNTSNPFFGELTFHIENVCESLGYKLLLCNSQNRIDKEQKYLEMLIGNQVDGVIAVTYNRGVLNSAKKELPIVSIDHYLSDTIPVVGSDNYEGGKSATELLIQKGCKTIIHINGPKDLRTPAALRRKAYEDVMIKNMLDPIIYEFSTNEDPAPIVRRMFWDYPDVDGMFASDDLLAAMFMNEAKRQGKQIPEDIKVIGYDGTETTSKLLPELSTIKQPIYEIGKTAIDRLVKRINGETDNLSSEFILPIELIENGTT
ncbi:LacI family DNA-binding transcriptional regulator [Bacillus lacus]|uniref:LacI family DNA-binding transcriptional regulator n=1 Tax=Metabacillus lacus TaxID=1983721 RepID=A0A7X2IZR3_9BACI|nr:LacI family DNA-binding transcriptional regulator [Metabacillus lacus]MRX72798.1 LacI family DNA-binding transcriptional regulator [Metabacillus lacus]